MRSLPFLTVLLLFVGLELPAASENRRSGGATSPNLLKNGDFGGKRRGWEAASWRKTGQVFLDTAESFRGKPALRLENTLPDHTMANQIAAVKPHTRYRISAFVKSEGVRFFERGRDGACLGIRGGYERSKALPAETDWTLVVFEFDSGNRTEVVVGPHLGWHGSTVTGRAWFADLHMEELGGSKPEKPSKGARISFGKEDTAE